MSKSVFKHVGTNVEYDYDERAAHGLMVKIAMFTLNPNDRFKLF